MSSEKVPNPTIAATPPPPSHGVEFVKGINGLDKVVLRDPRGSLAEVKLPSTKRRRFILSRGFSRFL